MIKLKDILKKIGIIDEAVLDQPSINQSHNSSTPEFVNYIKSVENGNKIGFKNNKWYPHKSFEGGYPTIGYGHKIKSEEELRQSSNGLSNSQVESLLRQDLEIAKKNVKSYINKKYKVDLMLSPEQEQMLIDFAFNLGGLDKFPKLTDAILRKNWNIVKKEYKRFSGNKELKDRNDRFYNTFLAKV
jgi:GH24 family phage-related lysozyme (muramidase)